MILMIIVTFSKYIFPLMLNMFRVKLISLVKNEDFFFVLVEKNNDKVPPINLKPSPFLHDGIYKSC